jgi:hypothetical protein
LFETSISALYIQQIMCEVHIEMNVDFHVKSDFQINLSVNKLEYVTQYYISLNTVNLFSSSFIHVNKRNVITWMQIYIKMPTVCN